MRLVTWNCNGAFRRKLHAVEALDADILVIQECEDPAHSTASYREWAEDYAWVGYGKTKGIGIFPRRGQPIERLEWPNNGFELFLPVKIGSTIIVGVWTQQGSSAKFGYIGQFWHYFQAHRAAFGPEVIIAGDFNSNTAWDLPRRAWNHTHCVRELGGLGFRSLYHRATDEAQGSESQPTFYLYRHEAKPHHIDYVFAHDACLVANQCSVQVGTFANWQALSDHMPVTVEI